MMKLWSRRVATLPKSIHTCQYSSQPQAPVTQFVNRNPRSAELTGAKVKEHGFYHKTVLTRTLNHTYGDVFDGTGRKIVSVSTREAWLREGLYGTNNTSAARNVGRVLAQRLLASGIGGVVWDRQGSRFHGKVKAFAMGLQEGGVKLKEP